MAGYVTVLSQQDTLPIINTIIYHVGTELESCVMQLLHPTLAGYDTFSYPVLSCMYIQGSKINLRVVM